MYSFFKLNEGLKKQELRDLIHNEIHIDEFQAKMNSDDQIIVVSFKAKYKPSSLDFESFLEKGYDFILDAETSNAEFENGWYLVYAEFERRLDFPDRLMAVIDDMKNITNVKKWKFKYGASRKKHTPEWSLSSENLTKYVPLSPKRYRDIEERKKNDDNIFEHMMISAGVSTKRYVVETPEIDALKDLAGIATIKKEYHEINITPEEYQMRELAGITVENISSYERVRRNV